MPAKSKSKNSAKEISASQVMSSVSSVVSFMKEQVTADLMEAKSKGKIDLNNEELKKICFYIESSLTNSFVKASGQIENTLR